jgi:hypothetical protein
MTKSRYAVRIQGAQINEINFALGLILSKKGFRG